MASTEKKAELSAARNDLEEQKIRDTVDRYQFLLGQTDLFAHFIRAKGKALII
jgi:hypothetical protein